MYIHLPYPNLVRGKDNQFLNVYMRRPFQAPDYSFGYIFRLERFESLVNSFRFVLISPHTHKAELGSNHTWHNICHPDFLSH